MAAKAILASKSAARIEMLTNAGLTFDVEPARLDEATVITSLNAEGHKPRNIADALAEAKAHKVAMKFPTRLVIGSDQVLEHEGQLLQKPASKEELAQQLADMSAKTHMLHAAAVIFEEARPVWRHTGTVKLTMHKLPRPYIDTYVNAFWDEVRHCVGGYRIEVEGIRLFSKIDGDYFHVMGFPLLECMNYLHIRGDVS